MEMQELEITIDKEGRVQIEVKGVHGESCVALTQSLEDAIGEVNDRSIAPEFFEDIRPETRLCTRNRQ